MTFAWRNSGMFWLWLTALVIALDQLTKAWIGLWLQPYQRVTVLPFFDITRVHNTGAAFSFLSDASGWQRWFFTLLALIASVVILAWLRRIPRREGWLAPGLALILGGALGNAWDRLQLGHVVDFIDFYYYDWHWPAFNIADSAITIGAAMLMVDMLVGRRRSGI